MRLLMKTSRAMLLCMLAGLVLSMLPGCALNTVKFRGDNLYEERSGINVIATQEQDVLAVTSTKYNYSLILPYAENWDFSWKEGFLLLGNSGPVHVTLSAALTEDSALKHLKRLRDSQSALNAIDGLQSARIIRHRGVNVLVSMVNGVAKLKGGNNGSFQHLNIFTARKWKNALYRLHISVPLSGAMDPGKVRSEFLDYATAGFSVTYMRSVDATDDSLGLITPWRRGGAKRKK